MPIQEKNKTAILVFAYSAQQEMVAKGIPKSTSVFEALSGRALDVVQRTQLPYFHLTEKLQIGDSFGERFVNAVQTVFDKGYEQIITIGNDTPQLKSIDILKAANSLGKGKVTLGPSADGGFYLMALRQSNFNAEAFQQLSWNSSKIFRQTKELLENQGIQVTLLKTLFDLDTKNDFELFLKRSLSVSRKLFSLFQDLFTKKLSYSLYRVIFLDTYLSNIFFNKGSPVLLHS